jgi:hypothetical protein
VTAPCSRDATGGLSIPARSKNVLIRKSQSYGKVHTPGGGRCSGRCGWACAHRGETCWP